MPNYRRSRVGTTFFFTVVTHGRRRWLCEEVARRALREAIVEVRASRPFGVEAFVLLPDHLHCLWTLPDDDVDYSTRWRLIKAGVTKRLGAVGALASPTHPTQGRLDTGPTSASRERRGEGLLWQRRFWEHTIRDDRDFEAHCASPAQPRRPLRVRGAPSWGDVHYNPVKHGLAVAPKDWPHSTFHRFVEKGIYPANWGSEPPGLPEGVGRE